MAMRWVSETIMSATTGVVDSFDVTSGANDIIVVRHENGELSSSPFTVRFGKLKVLRRSDKYIYVEVNGTRIDGVIMKLSGEGEAFWVAPAQGPVSTSLQTSPITSPLMSPRPRTPSDLPAAPSPVPPAAVESPEAEEPARRRRPKVLAPGEDLTEEAVMGWSDDDGGGGSGAADARPPYAAFEDEADQELTKQDSVMRELNERLQHVADSQSADSGLQPASTPPLAVPRPIGLQLARSNEGEGMPFQSAADDADSAERTFGEDGAAPPLAARPPGKSIPRLFTCHTLPDGDEPEVSFLTAAAPADRCDDDGPPDAEEAKPYSLSDDEGDAPPKEQPVEWEQLYEKRINPTSEQLSRFNLNPGRNEIRFVVNSSFRGEQVVTCWAYLVDHTKRLVISDIDGTITRSDILGHLLPRVGKDWTHEGICPLYQRIHENGYQLLYLSSRSLGQIQGTRDFIFNIVQDSQKLPLGPVLMAPDRIASAVAREMVTRTPHVFKSEMLLKVKAAFPADIEPFYAGFGNRINDAWAYQHVGIRDHKVFIIDTYSQIHVLDKRVRLSTYGSLDALADQAFPPCVKKAAPQEFNSFLFWSLDPGMGLYEVPAGKTRSQNPLGVDGPRVDSPAALGGSPRAHVDMMSGQSSPTGRPADVDGDAGTPKRHRHASASPDRSPGASPAPEPELPMSPPEPAESEPRSWFGMFSRSHQQQGHRQPVTPPQQEQAAHA
eukprot:TRINITY_DN6358_c0_g1_i1.p1 TRINITY_DN6358_c0_g1~~TRINITY_DN6358_c0_g1_i1.p1  ORF type:complete len:721 (+),score=195.72 TRINITY_DN6358_c0_g1_i1:175-2337(+)